MIFRLTQKLADKIKVNKLAEQPGVDNPFADWSCDLFQVGRTPFIIVSNTASLYSCIISGKGIVNQRRFAEKASAAIVEVCQSQVTAEVYEKLIAPVAEPVVFARSFNAATSGAIEDHIQNVVPGVAEGVSLDVLSSQINNERPNKLIHARPISKFVWLAKEHSVCIRCPWAKGEQYAAYHDEEWGVPVHDDRVLFEFLILEGAQAGLSWETILKKRHNYRAAFDQFDPEAIARYDDKKVQSLLGNEGIVRNRLKIESAIDNAKAFLKVRQEFGSFDKYVWRFAAEDRTPHSWKTLSEVPATTPASDAMSKDLKKRGFRFVGSTICYAFMQAVGMVNDHLTRCFRHYEIQDEFWDA